MPLLDPTAAREILRAAIDARAFPGCVLGVGHGTRLTTEAFGTLSYDEDQPVGEGTLYDLASLTKVVATATAAMILADERHLDLDAPVRRYLPECAGSGKDGILVWHLLSHASGWPAWAPLFREIKGKDAYLSRVLAWELAYPPGSRSLYSDLGFIVLGGLIEKVAGCALDVFASERILRPLGMSNTGYLPSAEVRARIAPTEDDAWRGRVLRGEVHDENAFAMGGVAPQAGLFGCAADLARFARMMLDTGQTGSGRLVSVESVRRFTARARLADSTWALGWDTPTRGAYSTSGSLLSEAAYGCVGFTGTSLWLDPQRDLFVILLTNRVHPSRTNTRIRSVRPALMDAVVKSVDSLSAEP